jgi:hypothetical protein
VYISRLIRSIAIGGAVIAGLYCLGSRYLGPGNADYAVAILGGYEFDDAGGYEKAIVYRGGAGPPTIVVDARVDAYEVVGNRIFVARRPRIVELAADGAPNSRLLPTCEYWVVDTKTRDVYQVPARTGMTCD